MSSKYHWMSEEQRKLYDELCAIFNFQRVADVGKFLGLNNPYHGARLIFESQKPNAYLCKLVEIKKEANEKIKRLSALHEEHDLFKEKVYSTIKRVEHSLQSVEKIKEEYSPNSTTQN